MGHTPERQLAYVLGGKMITNIHHVGIAVHDLDESLNFYRDTLNLHVHAQEEVADQGVRAALLTIGESEIELLEPLSADSPIGKFLERKGEGLHHICFETPDVDAELEGVKQREVAVIDEKPRKGLAGMICFLHPKASRGVLVELATP
jgi:methylmalonyl-CoA/ethylmalonyl-CoA epimerase